HRHVVPRTELSFRGECAADGVGAVGDLLPQLLGDGFKRVASHVPSSSCGRVTFPETGTVACHSRCVRLLDIFTSEPLCRRDYFTSEVVASGGSVSRVPRHLM